jgi:lysophospholipid acyltransferase (LPLAT)-like uncharacterized protein
MKIIPYFLSSIITILGQLWLKSLRIQFKKSKIPQKDSIIALWHENLPICIKIFQNRGYSVLISKSRDGEIASNICKKWGYTVFRGSSSRGGISGLKNLIRHLSTAGNLRLAGMALDGPHGPYHHLQPGTQRLSQITGIPVNPVAIKPIWSFRLSNWDRTIIPFPFSKILVHIGSSLIPNNCEELQTAIQKTESELLQ